MRKVVNFTLIIIVAILIPVLPFLIVGELPGELWLSRHDDNALLFGLTGSGLLVLDIAFPVPSSIIGSALGARLGFWYGLMWCWLGMMVGSLIGYCFGHLLPRRFAMVLPATPTAAILFLSRPVPVLAEAAAMAAGANRVSLRTFLISCALGNGVFSAALCFNAVLWLPGSLLGPWLVFPMLLPLVAWFSWRRFGPQMTARS